MRERIDFTPDYGIKAAQSIIKVLGVGGGGGNAVKHMYKEGIIGVDFMISNTDRNALEANPIPLKLVLGESGLGAGADPKVGCQLAMESRDRIIDFIGADTKMLFITAGMGKGTGTGAAPVVAEIAKEMGILTIAVVTLPFRFEGATPATFAEAGVAELKKHVDSLIVIKNQNIIKYYNDEEVDKAFGYVDDVLKNAVKCIAELITVNLEQNIDFNDINSILKNSGSAMLGVAEASGENRIKDVLFGVLRCPLLTEEHVTGAKNFLFSISYGSEQKLRISELQQLTECFEKLNSRNSHVIWGRNEDPTLGDKIKLSVIISNYSTNNVEFGSIGDLQSMFEGEKQQGSVIVDRGSNIFTPETNPLNNNDFRSSKNEIEDFGFLNKEDSAPIGSRVTEPELAGVPVDAGFLSAGPQMIRSTYEPKYEDDNQFAFLIDKPAVLRERQENKEDFQDKALLHNHAPSFMRINDLDDFFKNLPD